jgi:hypothetical protein
MTRHLVLALSFMLSLPLISQHTVSRDVLVKVDRSKRGDETSLIFNANNTTSGMQTIVLAISGRNFERADGSIPVVKKLLPGTNRIISLTNVSKWPEYSYMWVAGCVDTKPDDITYLLPVAPGKTTRLDSLTTIGEAFLGKDKVTELISFSFTAEPGDEVYAARRGMVIEVEESYPAPKGEGLAFRSKNNYLVIEHEDCTRGRYTMFAEKGIAAEMGTEVEAGDVLGKVMDGAAMTSGTQIRFSVYYPDLTRRSLIEMQEDRARSYERKYVAPTFLGLKIAGEATAEHPEEVIFQEMRKKAIKRWKKERGQ